MKRCTRLDLDSEMENFIKIGKDLGLEGDKLLQFAEKKEAEAIEREERNKERELRKLEIEAEKKRLEADAENKRIEADAENKRLEAVEAEKRRAHELETRLTRITGLLIGTQSLKCGGDTERSEALKQSIFKMADSMLHV